MAGMGGQVTDFFPGLLIGVVVWSVTPLFVWLYARSLGAHATRIRIGFGPVVHRSTGSMRLTEVRTVPLSFYARYLPRRETYGRDLRRIEGAFPVTATALAVAVAAVLLALREPAVAVVELVLVLYGQLRWVLRRDRGSRRRRIARILVTAPPQQDPMLADPRFGDWAHASFALAFGELDAAEQFVPVMRASGYPGNAADMMAADVHEVRGDYEAALAIVEGLPDADKPKLVLARMNLHLRIAERDRVPHPRVALEVQEYLARVPARAVRADQRAAVLALARLAAGNAADARGNTTHQTASASTPLELADAFCTQALIEAASHRPEQASRTLRRAQEFAPWYARVAIVRGLLGGAAVPPPAFPAARPATASTSTDAFTDPWAVPPE